MTQTVGERIAAIAVAKGFGYGQAFADLIGVTYETLRKWRVGTNAPTRARQNVISAVLGVPPSAFMHEASIALGMPGDLVAHNLSEPPLKIASMSDEGTIEIRNGVVAVPLMSAAGSMGAGLDQHDDVVVGRLSLSQAWIGKTIKPITETTNLRFIHGYGDSMAPTFNDGDVLLVDGGVRSIVVDGVYVLTAQDRLYIKRVRQRMDGSYEVSSDNPTVKTVDVLDGSHAVEVLGKVVWIWNGKKV